MIRQTLGGIVIHRASPLGSVPRRSIVTCKPAALRVARASARSTKLHHQQWVGGRSATGVICRQSLYAAPLRWHGGSAAPDDAPTITLTFLQPDDTTRQVPARVGETLLQTAHRNDIDLEGACEGVCACSTCHLILPPDLYGTLPDPSEDEEDMLDMAFGLTETSRLGCQITVTSDMDGAILEMPKATRNFYVDGHVPKPH